MNESKLLVDVWAILAVLLAFGVIAGSVVLNRIRARRLQKTRSEVVLRDFLGQGFAPEDVLIGVPMASWTRAMLLLRDLSGQPLGCVHYGWRDGIRIELDGCTYHVRDLPPLRGGPRALAKSELALDGEVLASRESGGLVTSTSRIHAPGLGVLEIDADLSSAFKSSFRILCDGALIGRVLDTGKFLRGQAALLLKGNLPLAVRAYILAMEFRRMT